MDDITQILESLNESFRSLSAEFTTIWLPIQLGLLLVAAAIGFGVALFLRRHVNAKTLLSGWPAVIRQLVLSLFQNLPFIIFAVIAAIMHAVLLEITIPARSYLLHIAISL